MSVTIGGGDLNFTASIDDSGLTASISRIQNQLLGLTKSSEQNASAIENLVQKTTSAIAAYASFSVGTNFIKDIVEVRGQFQQLEVAFQTMLGSKEKADKLLAQAVELAAKTPFTLQEVGTGAKQLLAYGFAADKITDNLTTLGNIAAGVGAPLGDIVYLYGTLKTQGRAYTRDILQFTSRGIPIIAELAKQFGVTEENVQKLVEGGKVGFPEVEKAFNALTSSGGLFFNLMQEQSKTLTGLTSNLKDAWSRMLNEIGKSNQGLFSDAIKGATVLVDNYKEVLKVIEILIAAYGSYRAAIIITNTVTAISTALTQGQTVAEILRAGAISISEKAMKLLNATMLANPATAVIAGILAFVSALYVLHQSAIKAKSSSELLADSQQRVSDSMAAQESKIRTYIETLKAGNVSEKQRAEIYKELNEISPKLVEGLNAQNISYLKLTDNLKLYLTELRKKLTLEANQDALTGSLKQEGAIQDVIDKRTQTIEKLKKQLDQTADTINTSGAPSLRTAIKFSLSHELAENERDLKTLKQQQKTSEEIAARGAARAAAANLSTDPVKKLTNKQQIDEAKGIDALDAVRKIIDEDYHRDHTQAQRDILKIDLEYADKRRKVLDVYGNAQKAAKDLAKEEKGITSLLEKRKNILEDIDALQRGAKQSGLIKEQSEIDKVNEKYDIAIQKIEDFNKKAADFNKKNPGAKVAAIGLTDIEDLNKARLQETTNVTLKANADAYLKSLTEQKNIFTQFEDSKKDIGIEKAKEMYAGELQGFSSYAGYLEDQISKIQPKVTLGTADIGDQLKLIGLQKDLTAAREDQSKREFEKQKQDYKNLLDATQTFNTEKLAINKRYNDLEITLARQNLNPDDFVAKTKLLEDQRKQDLTNLADNYAEQGKLFETLNQNIIRLTKKQLNDRLDLLKKYLKDGKIIENDGSETILTPAMIKSLEDGIKQAANFDESLDNIFKTLAEIGALDDVFSSLGDTLGSGFLQEAGKAISGIAGQLGNLQKALKAYKAGDKQAATEAGIAAAVNLVNIVVSSAAKRKQAEKEYYEAVIGGQYQYNLALNDQIRLQNELSKNVFYNDFKSKITDGIKAAADAVDNYQKALGKLKDGQAKTGQRNAVDFGAVGQGAAAGAALGAAVGTVVPVIGNVIGVVVGGIVGGIVGLLGGKKKKDIFTALLSEYPELIQKSIDGTEKFNETLAKSLIDNNLVNDATKGILNNIIDWSKKLEEARAQIKSVVSDLAGSLGDDLRNSLVDAFKNGTDAAVAFGESVNKTLENIISNFLFNQVFAKSFDELQKRMQKSFDVGGDNNFVDDITAFYKQAPELTKQFNDALAAAQKESDKYGLNVFGKNKNATGAQTNSLVGSIKASITEETGTVVAGQLGGLRLTALEQLRVSGDHLNALNSIVSNTAYLVAMDRRLANLEMNGIKIKP